MNDKEVAMHLAIEVYKDTNISLLDTYFKYLNCISFHKTNTLEGKLQEILKDYDNSPFHSAYDMSNFIDQVKKVLEEYK